MATRMQQRRGTAAQWISTHGGDGPILNAGEIGFETDTGKFKIGDGTNHWVDLDYFLDESDIDGITGDYVLANTLGQANGVATLDSSGKLTGSQIPGIDELAQDAVDLALVAGTGITKNYNDNANTITIAVDTTTIQARVSDVSDTEIGYLANVTSDIQTQLNSKASSTDLSNHESDTSNVHGILDTAELATKEFAANLLVNASKTNITITGDKNGLTIAAENGVADSNTDNLVEGSTNLYFTNARVRAAIDGGTGLDYNSSTGTFDIDSTVTTNTGNQTLTNKNIDLANNTVTGTVTQFNSALSDANFITTSDTGTVTSAMLADETIVNADIANNAAIAQSKIDGLTTDLAAKAALAGAAFTGNISTTGSLTVDGNFTVNGSNVLVSATQIQIEDSILQLAHENAANTVDLGIVAGYNDGTAKHAGLVKDATDGKWKLFKGVTTEPGTTVDFTQATLDDLTVGALEATSLTLGNVSNTEFGYLDGLASNVQDQINTKAPLSSPTLSDVTLTGTVTAGSSVGTNGQVLQSTGTGVQWGSVEALPSQSGNSGKYLTTDGNTASWSTLSVPITTGTVTVNTNTAYSIDTVALSAFTTIEYILSIKQGSKVRSSKVFVQENGSTVDFTEYAVMSTGGTISSVQVSAALSGSDSVLSVSIGDAATTNATVKFAKVVL